MGSRLALKVISSTQYAKKIVKGKERKLSRVQKSALGLFAEELVLVKMMKMIGVNNALTSMRSV